MGKNYFIFAAALMALASCQTDDYLGENTGNAEGMTMGAIRFDGGTGKITRADESTKKGEEAAKLLNKNFIVYGYKTLNNNTQVVYDHYNVNYLGDNAKSASNTKGWEYVGQTISSLNSTTDAEQTIKYWDYSASQYDFIAFSFGEANKTTSSTEGQDTQANTDKVTATKVSTTGEDAPSYTLTGNVDDLAKCYIADKVTAKKDENTKSYTASKYGEPVTFNFRSLSSKVQVGLYETIPGYSVKDVKFYDGTTSSKNDPSEKPTLYTSTENDKTIPATNGTMTVTFDNDNIAKVAWKVSNGDGNANARLISWKELTGKVIKEKKEDTETEDTNSKIYIGRESSSASKSGYRAVLPGTTVGTLNLKVNYTLVSTDGSKEEIKVTGATAVIPAAYTQWKPNYAYTYIFKISDKTNGSTGGTTDPAGLFPITFDAVVTETEAGKQETITEIDEASITTYSKGEIKNNEYATGSNIYVSVPNSNLVLASRENQAANCALYKATITSSTTQPITEAMVKKCLEGTAGTDGSYTLTLDTNVTLTVKKVGDTDEDKLEIVDKIASDDTVDGKEISGNFAKFKAASSATNYVFEYSDIKNTSNNQQSTTTNKYYKVIKVVAPSK